MKNNTLVQEKPLTYHVTVVEGGVWKHAPGSDFVFTYIDNSWSTEVKEAVGNAFLKALAMSSTIKQSVKETSGQDVVNGLYLLNQEAMTMAMNSIEGMGETSVDQQNQQGSGTAVSINAEFFAAILGGLSGDVAPMLTYLTTQMGDVQAQTRKSTVTEDFGIVVGLVSLMPDLNIPVTSFQYVYSSSQTSEWFVKTNCSSTEHHSYNYSYTVVDYNYVPSSN